MNCTSVRNTMSTTDQFAGLSPRLHSNAYIDPAFWQAECETVLAQNWCLAGFAHEFREPGDAIPVSVAGKPILLVRNTDNQGLSC